jgi:hypothetical protein
VKAETFHLRKGGSIDRLVSFLSALLRDHDVDVTVKRHRDRRSDQQNRYLWGAVYPAILKHLEGWDAEDIHEFCLGEWSGWEILEGLGRKRMKPLRRSSKLSTTEFMDFVDHIQRTMAEKGIYIPDPNEDAPGVIGGDFALCGVSLDGDPSVTDVDGQLPRLCEYRDAVECEQCRAVLNHCAKSFHLFAGGVWRLMESPL